MRKLLIFSLLFISSILVNAQTAEPTKEETIKYIDSWLKQNVIGKENKTGWVITEISFSETKLEYSVYTSTGNTQTHYQTGMDWSSIDTLRFDWIQPIAIFFTKKTIKNDYGAIASVLTVKYCAAFTDEKQKQLVKAFSHLKKLASEGSKNSYFDN